MLSAIGAADPSGAAGPLLVVFTRATAPSTSAAPTKASPSRMRDGSAGRAPRSSPERRQHLPDEARLRGARRLAVRADRGADDHQPLEPECGQLAKTRDHAGRRTVDGEARGEVVVEEGRLRAAGPRVAVHVVGVV